MKKLFSAALISIGSFLEIFFYYWRFKQEGIPAWLSVIIGSSLTLLLTASVYQRRYKWAIFIIIPLSLYSVFATSAGQAFSLNEKIKDEEQASVDAENNNENIKEIENQITEINEEIFMIQAAMKKTVDSLENAWDYRGTLERSQKRIDILREDRKQLTEDLKTMREKSTTHEKVKTRANNIYTFYADMIHFSDYWLQFILQTILSAFIAIMSPIGLILYNSDGKETEKEIIKPVQKYSQKRNKNIPKVSKEKIDQWVFINWYGIRCDKSRYIIPEKSYINYFKRNKMQFDKKFYDKILEKAQALQFIDDNRIIIEKNEEKVKSGLYKEIKDNE